MVAIHYIDKSKLIIFEDGIWSQKARNKLGSPGRQKTGYKRGQKDISRGEKKKKWGVSIYIFYEEIVQTLIMDWGTFV